MSDRLGALLRALGIALALGACAPGAAETPPAGPPPDPVLVALGEPVYLRLCASCHGEGGRGDGPAAGALRVAPADLARIAARRGGDFPEGEIARFIDGRFSVTAHGSREMPIWGERLGDRIPEAGVSEEVVRGQISALVAYLKSIQNRD